MEGQTDQESAFDSVVDTLVNMFGDVLCRDAIFAVVDSCDGDLSMAAEAIMNITSDPGNDEPSQVNAAAAVTECSSSVAMKPTHFVETNLVKFCPPEDIKPSYASASRNTGAIPKQLPYSSRFPQPALEWSEQIKRIFTYHNKGYRVFIVMRGAPGCGKTFLAKQLIDATIGSKYTDYTTHICSTDDYFMVRGTYKYDKSRLRDAHDWNQHRVKTLLKQGLSPLILDNTNIEIWEMEPYIRWAVENGYYIELVEPTTSWVKKPTVLFRKNTHNVPLITIRRMLDNYQNTTVEEFFHRHNIFYPPGKDPPVLRLIPPLPETPEIKEEDTTKVKTTVKLEYDPKSKPGINKSEEKINQEVNFKMENVEQKSLGEQELLRGENVNEEESVAEEETIKKKQEKFKEFQKKLEEFEKVEIQWEKGDSWDDGDKKKQSPEIVSENAQFVEPKPPRTIKQQEESTTSLEKVQNCLDWSKISLFMPCWNEGPKVSPTEMPGEKVETKSSSTCIERYDTDIDNAKKILKIISATPRDINLYYIPPVNEKIPIKRMLDKSTLTNEQSIMDAFRCENEEQHFKAFRRLFKNIPKDYLRDIFDNCQGDVNWAVSIVLEDTISSTLKSQEEDLSEEEEGETSKQCSCLAAYDIIPNTRKETSSAANKEEVGAVATSLQPETSETPVKRMKTSPSQSSVQLKQEIEKNIVISDEHYSEHCLKIKKLREGIVVTSNTPPIDDGNEVNAVGVTEAGDQVPKVNPSDDEESVTSEEAEKIVTINIGREFLGELDNLFGRKGMIYPDGIVPRINIPISLLNEINAFWMESLMHQMDVRDKLHARMLEEDAVFARQLQLKEEELVKAGKEPEVPDFKEIMDMDLALSLYQKEVAEWRNKEPTDIAAKMTRDKLYNLFPDVSQDILSELLMAHENNFRDTVEVLLVSTGQANILDEKNGLNKFVMNKEMERQEKILAEEKKALSEVEWPLLPMGENVGMGTVNEYRTKADLHLSSRNTSIQKAQEYIRRGMTQVANYYSDIASFHKDQYEHNSSLAAMALIQIHATNSPDNATIDLHYLRVNEAKETLDLFLDSHISKLRDSPVKGVRCHTLFFITGRGLHSNGKPRVKPAVKRRLRERGIECSERNPGLLTAKVCADHKLSYQMPTP